jgi:pimeloyl-ACP methyl ester carboxylesterase
MTWTLNADDLADLVEELDLKNAVYVGHSTGGGEVARYIGWHGNRCGDIRASRKNGGYLPSIPGTQRNRRKPFRYRHLKGGQKMLSNSLSCSQPSERTLKDCETRMTVLSPLLLTSAGAARVSLGATLPIGERARGEKKARGFLFR